MACNPRSCISHSFKQLHDFGITTLSQIIHPFNWLELFVFQHKIRPDKERTHITLHHWLREQKLYPTCVESLQELVRALAKGQVEQNLLRIVTEDCQWYFLFYHVR